MPPLKGLIDADAIGEFCRRWNVTELSVFGSALREDFGADSDVDVMVTFAADARPTLFDMVHMKEQLEAVLGHRVDLVSRRGVEQSRNYLRREAILSSAKPIYAER